jgi:hypothetical protein
MLLGPLRTKPESCFLELILSLALEKRLFPLLLLLLLFELLELFEEEEEELPPALLPYLEAAFFTEVLGLMVFGFGFGEDDELRTTRGWAGALFFLKEILGLEGALEKSPPVRERM